MSDQRARFEREIKEIREADTLADELMAFGADLARMSPASRHAAELGLRALNGAGRPHEAAGTPTHEGGTPREHGAG